MDERRVETVGDALYASQVLLGAVGRTGWLTEYESWLLVDARERVDTLAAHIETQGALSEAPLWARESAASADSEGGG